ncbi:hypothetical protein GCM10027176_73540 [Actinoallomurus bryophytorum]
MNTIFPCTGMRLSTGGSGPDGSTVRVTCAVVAVFPPGRLVAGGPALRRPAGRRDRACPPDLEAVGVPAADRGSVVW